MSAGLGVRGWSLRLLLPRRRLQLRVERWGGLGLRCRRGGRVAGCVSVEAF
jgi:hypothetical protein